MCIVVLFAVNKCAINRDGSKNRESWLKFEYIVKNMLNVTLNDKHDSFLTFYYNKWNLSQFKLEREQKMVS